VEQTISLHIECAECGTLFAIQAPVTGLDAYRNGMFIQDALPELSMDERELILSKTCGDCFDLMFMDDGEEE